MNIDRNAIIAVLTRHGWTAEWEPGQQDDDEPPVRFVFGSAGHRGRDGALTLHWGQMALSNHPTLEMSVWGEGITVACVDLVTTPLAEIPETLRDAARRRMVEIVDHLLSAQSWVKVLPMPPRAEPPTIAHTDEGLPF